MRNKGEAYPNDFRRSHLAADLHREWGEHKALPLADAAPRAVVAGRIMNVRLMGQAAFVNLRDMSGDIQLYIRKDTVGEEAYEDFKHWDNGDIIGAGGVLQRMKSGELSVRVDSLRQLVKCLQPMPEKYHGLSNIEDRHRHRYIDLMVHPEVRAAFVRRSRIISALRRFFDQRGFLEVETPMMHTLASGALAKPFKTHHQALDMPLFLRIAPELYLKRLVVGGFEKVYEMNRNFRNEGVSTRHNPEFTMLEFYQAYSDYRDLMDLIETMLKQLWQEVCTENEEAGHTGQERGAEGLVTDRLRYGEHEIDMKQPFARRSLEQMVCQHHPELFDGEKFVEHKVKAYVQAHGLDLSEKEMKDAELAQFALFEKTIEAKIIQPTFVTGYPKSVSPLARSCSDRPATVERFELFAGGYELANGFSELNDPEDQKERFEEQQRAREQGDEESMPYDADYLHALEYGLPPTAGAGIGIDRLVMLFGNVSSIRDAILFPLLRKQD